MSDKFDPYRTWLGIPPEEQPPDYYRLLALRRFEKKPEVIESAAAQRIAGLQAHRTGEHAPACLKLIAEIHAARMCLVSENRRAAYDLRLLQKMAVQVVEEEKAGKAVQITAEQFVGMLEEKDLVPAELLAALRRQIAESKTYVSARHVAQTLVDKGVLTPILAKRLLSRGAPEGAEASSAAAQPHPKSANLDDLSLVPLEDERALKRAQQKSRHPATEPQPPAAKTHIEKSGGAAKPPVPTGMAAPSGAGSLLDEELAIVSGRPEGLASAGPLDQLLSDPELQAAAAKGSPLLPVAPQKTGLRRLFGRRTRFGAKPRIWSSPWFLISAGIFWLLLVFGAILFLRP